MGCAVLYYYCWCCCCGKVKLWKNFVICLSSEKWREKEVMMGGEGGMGGGGWEKKKKKNKVYAILEATTNIFYMALWKRKKYSIYVFINVCQKSSRRDVEREER